MTALKTATFACVHFTVAFGVGWIVTGSPVIGGVLAVVEPMVNTVAFYLHERVWLRFRANSGGAATGHSRGCAAHDSPSTRPVGRTTLGDRIYEPIGV